MNKESLLHDIFYYGDACHRFVNGRVYIIRNVKCANNLRLLQTKNATALYRAKIFLPFYAQICMKYIYEITEIKKYEKNIRAYFLLITNIYTFITLLCTVLDQ